MLPVILGALGALVLAGLGYFLRGQRLIKKARAIEAETEAMDAQRGDASAALGFVPAEQLDTEHGRKPEPGEEAVRAAVHAGDWQAAATWLEEAGKDWEERFQRTRLLAREAAEDDAWLLAWRAAAPEDAGAAVVHADAEVAVAWNVRGTKRASHTSREQFRIFHQLLGRAQEAAHEAQRLAGADDPVPYMVEQAIALGLGYEHERYRQLWAQIVSRAPRVVTAHNHALQYWCRKWQGSHELALAFAKESAAVGKPGDLLTFIPLCAYFEHEQHESDIDPDIFYKSPDIVAAVDAALADAAVCAPGDLRLVWVRHMLAWLLFWQDRYEEAVEQLRHVDGWIGEAPWTYSGDPVDRYTNVRDYCARQVL
ncbi:hypothetical protein [Streptomyces sp. NPDC000410]|uniref:hypothetical protein n=1 Tax=Streptomyces sp. NPDC000410 TaxID=3154254 RepID=UPI0033344C3A